MQETFNNKKYGPQTNYTPLAYHYLISMPTSLLKK